MVVKDRIGRRRYIIVMNVPKLRKLIYEIRRIDTAAKIAYYEEEYAVVRCRHWYKEKIIEYLRKMGIKTITTTGTIKKAKRIIKNLKLKEK